MALPETVRVKLSSEAAESISLTPVVVQDLPIRDLLEHVVGVTGKDETRIHEILLRGNLVSGASRLRWAGWDADPESVRAVLATFPDADPSRAFARGRCVRAVLLGGRKVIEIPRAAGERKSLFRRSGFWDVLMEVASAPGLAYAGYSYRDRADRYFREISVEETHRLRAASASVRFTTLRDQLRSTGFSAIELYVER
jgi:hypothetical protein